MAAPSSTRPDPHADPPRGSATGALWTAGLGAFLLVAAAATFVAVNWGEIDERIKLGALVVVTYLCLLAHRRLRDSLPLTAAALFHLGVLLVPIDVAAVGLGLDWAPEGSARLADDAWSKMLLAEGVAATVTFGVAAWVQRSVVLRMAAWVGVVTLAAGIGGTTDLPAGLVLAAVALLATVVAPYVDRPGTGAGPEAAADGRWLGIEWGGAGWAALAGLAVPLSGAQELGWPAAGVLTDLGLAGAPPHPTAAATGLVAGLALGLVAHRHRSVPVALLGLASALTGLVTTWVGLEPSGSASLAAVAGLLLVAQVAAWVWREDEFWARPTALVARVAELATAVFTVGLVGVLVVTPADAVRDPAAGMAAGLVALTWLVGEAHIQRFATGRPGAFWLEDSPLPVSAALAPFGAAVAAGAAVALLSGSALATAVAMTGFGGLAVVVAPLLSAQWPARGDAHQILAAHLLAYAPFVAAEEAGVAAALALVGALTVAEAAVRTSRVAPTPATGGPGGTGQPGRSVTRPTAMVLAALSIMPVVAGAIVVAAEDHGVAAAAGAVVAGWLVAAVLDRAASPAGAVPLALLPRVAALVPLAFLPMLPNDAEAGIAALVVVLAVVDAVRRDEPLLVVGAGAALPFGVLGLAGDAGWSSAEASVLVTLTGIAWLGLGASLPSRWTPPMVVSAIGAAGAGLALGLEDAGATGTNLLLVGGTLAAVGLVVRRSEPTTIGLGLATLGLWAHLQQAGVAAAEPYVLPVALMLLVAGVHAQREHGVGSWLAYAPPVVLLGGAALLERLDGGGAGHALVAGAVGGVAVAVGGARRLAGPLLAGTVLVVATTVHETLGVTARIGTPVWLAIGGLVLLSAGIAMERRGVGPVEAGRRLIDVVNERFA